MKKFIVFLLPAFVALPVFAQIPVGNTVFNILGIFQNILNTLVPVFIALATIYVIYNAILFAKGEGEGKDTARGHLINGIIALFVIVSIWGLVAILNTTFGIGQGTGPSGVQSFGCFDSATGMMVPAGTPGAPC